MITYIKNSIFNSVTYIISYDNVNCWLIDCGDIDIIIEKGYNVKGVFLTHTHFDHIYGIPQLVKYFPNCQIYTSAWGIKGLASDKLNFSRYHGIPITYVDDNIIELHEGDSVEVFEGVSLEVYETPGHDRGCLTYRIGDKLFTGDSYIPGCKVVTSFPYSNKEDAVYSKMRIIDLAKDCTLYPGHALNN